MISKTDFFLSPIFLLRHIASACGSEGIFIPAKLKAKALQRSRIAVRSLVILSDHLAYSLKPKAIMFNSP